MARQPEATSGAPVPMPVITLALALPAIAAAAVKVRFSTLADRVMVPRRLPHR